MWDTSIFPVKTIIFITANDIFGVNRVVIYANNSTFIYGCQTINWSIITINHIKQNLCSHSHYQKDTVEQWNPRNKHIDYALCRSNIYTYISISISIYLYIYIYISISIYLSNLSIYLSIYLYIYISSFSPGKSVCGGGGGGGGGRQQTESKQYHSPLQRCLFSTSSCFPCYQDIPWWLRDFSVR